MVGKTGASSRGNPGATSGNLILVALFHETYRILFKEIFTIASFYMTAFLHHTRLLCQVLIECDILECCPTTTGITDDSEWRS